MDDHGYTETYLCLGTGAHMYYGNGALIWGHGCSYMNAVAHKHRITVGALQGDLQTGGRRIALHAKSEDRSFLRLHEPHW